MGQQSVYVPEKSRHVATSRCSKEVKSLKVEGTINGRKWPLIVDTGSNRTLLRRDLLDGSSLPRIEGGLCDVTGRCTTLWGPKEIELTVHGISTNLQVYVADELDEPCILGLDYLQLNECKLDIPAKELKIRGITVPITLGDVDQPPSKTLRVRVFETTTLRPESETLLCCSTEGRGFDNPGLVESGHVRRSGVVVGRTIVDTANSSIPVLVANLSKVPIRLQAGTYVGQCEPVEVMTSSQTMHSSLGDGQLPEHLEDLMERSSQGLTEDQCRGVRKLLGDFADTFSSGDHDLGKTNLVQHRIETGQAQPIKLPPRRIPMSKRKEAETMIRDMSDQGLIERSNSPWSSPLVLVKKKDGSLRCCVDYRLLNDSTVKDSYPLPRIDDTLDALSGAHWFSTLDLKAGYHQISVAKQDRMKTAFSSSSGLWQWRVMPFGLCNAPATFERLMEAVLSGLHWRTLLVYLDDVIVFGKTFDDELNRLREVLQRMRAANLKLNPKKCNLFRREVCYLGHIVSADGVMTDPMKTKAVRDWPVPSTKKELRSFLGLCTYYRRFVKDFASIAAPLHALTKDKVSFSWDESCSESFDQLKDALTSTPVLTYPDPAKEFILDTDASGCGVGAVLSQSHNGSEHVVAYYSRSLTSPEKNYCTTRRELLAIVESVRHFHHYLYGTPFTIRTDHSALRWLQSLKDPEGQLARWLARLGQYHFKVCHRPGKKHANADGLSRRPCQDGCKYCQRRESIPGGQCRVTTSLVESLPVDTAAPDTTGSGAGPRGEVELAQRTDPDLAPLIVFMEQGSERPQWEDVASSSGVTKRYWAQWDMLRLSGRLLQRAWESPNGQRLKWLVVVPRSKREEIMAESHGSVSSGHFGTKKTLCRLRERFYWVGMRRDVTEWCRTCEVCAAKKGPPRAPQGPLQIHNAGAPMERVAIDIVGPFPVSSSGNRYILVAMDYFTKWPEAYAIPNQEATTVAQVLVEQFFSRFGVPLRLHSDQGRNFESCVFRECCQILGIEKTRTTPMHPESDGMVERFNRTLGQELAKRCKGKQEDWDKHLPFLLMAYRSAEHETTQYTPAQLMMGRDLRLPIDLMIERPPGDNEIHETTTHYVRDLRQKLSETHSHVRTNLQLSSQAMKLRKDAKASTKLLQPEDQVWLYNPKRKKGLSPKFMSPWEGPYRVVKRLSDVTYRIQKIGEGALKVVHFNRLWKIEGPPHFSWQVSKCDSVLRLEDSPVSGAEPAALPPAATEDNHIRYDGSGENIENVQKQKLRRNRRPPSRFGDIVTHFSQCHA